MQALVGSRIRQAKNQVRISMEVEYDRPVSGEQRVIVRICQSMRMVLFGFELEQVHYVDETDLDIRKLLAQKRGRSQRFLCRNVARTSHDYVGFDTLVIA